MLSLNLINKFARVTLQSCPSVNVRNIATGSSLLFRATPCLFGEPLKKKKRLDPAIVRAREERRKKKLEKQIRRLEKGARQLKPIDECEIPLTITDQQKKRARQLPPLTNAEVERRILLEKQWAQYRHKQHLADVQMIDRIIYAQQRALDELRKESEQLYQEAIQNDSMLLPYKHEGPVETPPIKDYDAADGDYQDVSKKWTQ